MSVGNVRSLAKVIIGVVWLVIGHAGEMWPDGLNVMTY